MYELNLENGFLRAFSKNEEGVWFSASFGFSAALLVPMTLESDRVKAMLKKILVHAFTDSLFSNSCELQDTNDGQTIIKLSPHS